MHNRFLYYLQNQLIALYLYPIIHMKVRVTLVNLGEIICLWVCLIFMEGVSLSETLETFDPGMVATQGDIDLLEEVALEVLETLGDHQDQEEMALRIMSLGHIARGHKQVETFNIQQQLQEDRVHLDLDLAPPQG